MHLPSYQPTIEPNELQIKKIIKQISKAKKPVLLSGGSINYAEAAEDTEHNAFAVQERQGGNTKIHRLVAAHTDLDAAVLRHAAFGDVQPGS